MFGRCLECGAGFSRRSAAGGVDIPGITSGKGSKPNTLWSSNVAMENPPFIEYGPFKTRISKISD
jgi:hypothetical protein